MEQLNGLDDLFLRAELPGLPMTIASMSIYDPSTASHGTVRFKDILQVFENGLPDASVFRRRLVEVPWRLDHPYWIEDPDFDVEYHVRHIALPKPGDWRQLFIQLARLISRPLDRSRPLWEAYVIGGLNHLEGIPAGSFGMLVKVHHAAMDGASGIETFKSLHDTRPIRPRARHPQQALLREPHPGALSLLTRAGINAARRTTAGAFGMAADTARACVRLGRGLAEGSYHIERHPHCRFNTRVSAHRVTGRYALGLGEIDRIRATVAGATVNDVIITIIGGALREYLQANGELPGISLVAGIPVDIRRSLPATVGGNLLSMMNVRLGTDVDDPVERLRRVHDDAVRAKAQTRDLGLELFNRLTELLPPYLIDWGLRIAMGSGILSAAAPLPNTIISNIPGVSIPLYLAGAEMVDTFALGPLLPNIGLFHAVTNCRAEVTIGLTAGRQMLPDPAVYTLALRDSHQALRDACGISAD